jgi:acyl-CoA hydrolase
MITSKHLNSNGILFGGQLMKWMDETAFIAATRYTRKRTVTSSVDKILFRAPVKEGAILEIRSWVKENKTYKLIIYTEVIVEEIFEQKKSIAAESWFSFVSVNENGNPCRIKNESIEEESDQSHLNEE